MGFSGKHEQLQSAGRQTVTVCPLRNERCYFHSDVTITIYNIYDT